MSFDLYFAGGYDEKTATLFASRNSARLYTQLERNSIKKHIEYTSNILGNSQKLFIDSGAFSSWTRSVDVDVDEYIEYINSIDDKITIVAQVDCIPGKFGVPRTLQDTKIASKLTWENYLYMVDKMKSPEKLIAIFHQEEDFKHLINMLEYKYPNGKKIAYIGISPANDRSQKDKEQFIEKSFDIISKSSNPNVKTHAFGMTNLSILERYPYTSADSTTWRQAAAYGELITDYGRIYVSEKGEFRPNHIKYLPTHIQVYVKHLCDIYELDYDALGTDSLERSKFNICYLQNWADNYVYKPINIRRKSLF